MDYDPKDLLINNNGNIWRIEKEKSSNMDLTYNIRFLAYYYEYNRNVGFSFTTSTFKIKGFFLNLVQYLILYKYKLSLL